MNKNLKIIKKHPFKASLIALTTFIVLFVAGNNIYHATKVKDINDPRFDPTAYRFEDYTAYGENEKVLKKMFPVGSSREKFEELIVNKLGATPHILSPNIKSRFGNDHTIIGYKTPYNPFLCEALPWKLILTWPLYVGGRNIWIDYDKNNHIAEFISVMVP